MVGVGRVSCGGVPGAIDGTNVVVAGAGAVLDDSGAEPGGTGVDGLVALLNVAVAGFGRDGAVEVGGVDGAVDAVCASAEKL